MAIKVKAVERKLKFTKNENDPGVYRYVLGAELYTALNQKKVIREAALRSGVSQGVMQACWDAAGEVIKAWATEGHSVALPGLGSMRFSACEECGEGGGREVEPDLESQDYLHPDAGPEGRAGQHRHPDYLLRPQRRDREARDLG